MSTTDLGLGVATFALTRDTGTSPTHACLPQNGPPRLLVPLRSALAAGKSIRSYTTPHSRLKHGALIIGAALARAGATRLVREKVALGGSGTFIEHLEGIFGVHPLTFSVHLGPPRANRKPVIHIMDDRGQSIAFAKLGVDELTSRRVRHEANALRRLSAQEFSSFSVPVLVDAGHWQGLEYLVMRPLPNDASRVPDRDSRERATRALSRAFPVTRGELHAADWLARTLQEFERCDCSDTTVRLGAAIDKLLRYAGDRVMATGAAHGDWSRWNMSAGSSGMVVWDWERFADDTPFGWDELHFVIGAHPGGAKSALADYRSVLRECFNGVIDAEGELLLATYLVHRGVAYLADRQMEAGAHTGPLEEWLLPALEDLLERIRTGS